jgi:hypothetical protein
MDTFLAPKMILLADKYRFSHDHELRAKAVEFEEVCKNGDIQ